MELTKKHKLILLSIAVIIFAAISIREVMHHRSKTYILASTSETTGSVNESVETNFEQEAVADPIEPRAIVVHVEGEVERPGVYELSEGDRVVDVIDMAGGLNPNADRRRINMALKLQDEMFLYIPHEEEDEAQNPFENSIKNNSMVTSSASNNGLININTADAGTLETLPGIGPVLAQRIIDHRQQTGNFSSKEELKNVSGIGDARYRDIADHVTVR
ncbi:MAG: competence protein ComEA [Tindallia sp. MSAO_Bac2]|nr:MAG: competence protein ComEA [Tindallia sp. MSAO_Bac2]